MNTEENIVQFGTLMFELLDTSATTSTYKYAVLLGLIDACQSQVQKDGSAPEVITTRELARKVLEIYWGQAREFSQPGGGEVLRQNSGGQATIITRIVEFRELNPKLTTTFLSAQNVPDAFRRLSAPSYPEGVGEHSSYLQSAAVQGFGIVPLRRQAFLTLVEPLLEVQQNRCFYCDARIKSRPQVDHFIPWSRCPNDQNFVLAHDACNGSKSNHLAGLGHLRKWATRNRFEGEQGRRFERIALTTPWLQNPEETLSVTRSVYRSLPNTMPLWVDKQAFESANIDAIMKVLDAG